LLAVPYAIDKNAFQAGKPQLLFDSRFEMRSPYTSFDVTADGQHFVAFQFEDGKAAVRSDPVVVINWLDAVRRQVSAGQSTKSK